MTTQDRPGTEIPKVSKYDALLGAVEHLEGVMARADETPARWAALLERSVRDLGGAFELHRDAAEAEDGNLATITATKPALIHAVDALKTEHQDLLLKATALVDEIHTARAFDEIPVDRFRLAAQILCDTVKLHIKTGADLLYEAFYRVEGGEGG